MKFARKLIRQVLLSLFSFFVLTLVLFIFWRSFPDTALVSTLLYPHSQISRSLQISLIMAYLHLNLPTYLQYFGFLENIFTGQWAYLYPSISLALRNTVLLILLTFALTYLFLKISLKVKPDRIAATKRSGRAETFLYGIAAILILGVIYYILKAFGAVLSNSYYDLLGTGAVAQGFQTPGWIYSTYFPFLNYSYSTSVMVLVSSPTHILILDALIHGDPGYFFAFLIHTLPTAITVSLILTWATIFMIRRTPIGKVRGSLPMSENKEYSEGIGIAGKRSHKSYVRQVILKQAAYLGLVLIAAEIYSESLFSYDAGLGYYLPFSFYSFPPFTLQVLNVWAAVYLILTFGVLWIIMAFVGSVFRIYFESKPGHDDNVREKLNPNRKSLETR